MAAKLVTDLKELAKLHREGMLGKEDFVMAKAIVFQKFRGVRLYLPFEFSFLSFPYPFRKTTSSLPERNTHTPC